MFILKRNTGPSAKYPRKNAKSTYNTQKIARRTTIRRNQKHIPLRPCQSHHNTTNTHQKYIHLLLLQPHAIKHPQTKKHHIANANKKIGKNRENK
jgi:desulfoferrodoxin (superoxide reductase-like protein)